MPFIKVVSWNLRTFAERRKSDDAITAIADIIKDADIVGIQEVMSIEYLESGHQFDDRPPSEKARAEIARVVEKLNYLDSTGFRLTGLTPNSEWDAIISPGNAGNHFDHFAFLYKKKPNSSAFKGAIDRPATIELVHGPHDDPHESPFKVMRLDTYGTPTAQGSAG